MSKWQICSLPTLFKCHIKTPICCVFFQYCAVTIFLKYLFIYIFLDVCSSAHIFPGRLLQLVDVNNLLQEAFAGFGLKSLEQFHAFMLLHLWHGHRKSCIALSNQFTYSFLSCCWCQILSNALLFMISMLYLQIDVMHNRGFCLQIHKWEIMPFKWAFLTSLSSWCTL